MNIRHAVICERLRLRARVFGWTPPNPPTTEDQLDATEHGLGFVLPPLLRQLYLTVGNGGDGILEDGYKVWGVRSAVSLGEDDEFYRVRDLEHTRSRSGRRFSDETVAALRARPGSYIEPEFWPDGFMELAFVGCSVMVLLDGWTGHVYIDDAGETWSYMSFCAPSVEDWLERELDATLDVITHYFPEAINRGERITTPVLVEESSAGRSPSSAASRPALPTLAEARAETQRLRAENLGDEGEDPVEKAAKARYRSASSSHVSIEHAGWKIQQARHRLLQELYALIDILETEQAEAKGQPVGEEQFLNGLRPLLEADAHLAYMLEQPQGGLSDLYEDNRRLRDLIARSLLS